MEANANMKRFFLICALHIAILFHLAIAQPLLQKLADNPEFLIAHAASPGDIFALLTILCFLLPALLIALEGVARIFSRAAMQLVHHTLLFCLLTILAFLLIQQIKFLQGIPAIGAAVLIGTILTYLYRAQVVRSSLTYLAPVIIVIPLLFLMNSSIRKLISTNQIATHSASESATVPIVMVVFDELPVTSLMNQDLLLDDVLYPNFASLTDHFTWYRNTTTVSQVTTSAVPAILTGKYPDRKLLPTLSDHPENLFTLLGGSHELKVLETATSLCPPQSNVLRSDTSESRFSHLRLLIMDLSAVYLQMVVPAPYSSQLPDVTTTWGDFWTPQDQNGIKKSDRPALFETFIQSITPSDKPFFSFLHISLPHRPWRYLPDGKEYDDFQEGRRVDKFWEVDDWAARVAVQRHLLQLGYADRLLGELIRHLKTTGLYDRCLIVIVADHGISLWPGVEARKATPTTYQDILFVPFFLKAPFQDKGAIVDYRIETVDIVPTIVKVLGIQTSWKFDGFPAMDAGIQERRERKMFLHDRLLSGLHLDIHDENRTLQRKTMLF